VNNFKANNGPVPSTETAPPPTSSWHKFGVSAVRDGLVEVRKGIEVFGLEVAAGNRGLCGIVSVNFSKDFIQGVVSAISSSLDGIDVVANVPNAAGVLRGFDISDKSHPMEVIATSDGKLAAMKGLLEYWHETGALADDCPYPVYIGDSGTDIECLTEEGIVGVMVSGNGESSLMETLKRIDVEVIPIGEFRKREEKSVFWARDFTEIVNSSLLDKSPE